MVSAATKSPASVPFRAVLISILVLWMAYFAIATLRWEVINVGYAAEMLERRALAVFCGVLVTLLLWLLLRLFDARPLWTKILAALVLAMPVAIIHAQANHMIFSDLNQMMKAEEAEKTANQQGNLIIDTPAPNTRDRGQAGQTDQPETEREFVEKSQYDSWMSFLEPLTDLAFSRYFMMLAWSAIYFSMLATAQARMAERREQEFRNAAKAAELRSLRYQVNPHFLFNTLNSLSALVITGKTERAERMIQTISSFYRHSLTDEPTSDVPLEQEFDLQRHYLNIEEVRFPERLRTEFDLPETLEDARVPGMILQPLVENSVKYAVSPTSKPVTVRISAKEEFDRLVITVIDDGLGVPEGEQKGFGIGLANVRDRLVARFGPDISLTSGRVPGGYKSEMRIPLTRNG